MTRMPEPLRQGAAALAPAALVVAVQLVWFPAPLGILVRGATIGLLTALLAVGMALVYRANRVVNFAQGDLGFVPGLLGVMLVLFSGVPYGLGFAAGLGAAIVLGAVVELAIVRRFFRAPRLILTVATLGLAQLLTGGAILLARLWDESAFSQRIDTPGLTFRFTIEPLVFEADYVVTWVVGAAAMLGVALFLRCTAIGTAVRAAADSADRAALLGVPVGRLHTVVWVVAAVLSFVALWLRASLIGLPIGSSVGFLVLLRALAALVLGQMTHLPAVAASAIALGMLETAVTFSADTTDTIAAILGAVIVVALLLRRPTAERAARLVASTWQAVEEVRPVPRELRHLPEVRLARIGVPALVALVAVVLPHLLDTERSLKASALLAYSIIGVSIVVLTGWAGQVSLGQMAFVAWGGAVTAKVTQAWNADLLIAAGCSLVVGAAVAAVVGLPALRLRGLHLAVTTLAFALATSSYFLNEEFFGWVSDDRFERLPLLGRIDLASPTRIYYVLLAGLVLTLVALTGIRRSRTGRVLVALRDNEAAVQSYGVSVTRAKLTGFAISGAVAAFAGSLLVYHQQAYDSATYLPFASLSVFTMAVFGGLGSLLGGVLGAAYLLGARWFLPGDWVALASGAGVLAALLVVPQGVAGLVVRVRDLGLRWVAQRRGIVVPSLLADTAAPPLAVTAADEGTRAEVLARGGAPR